MIITKTPLRVSFCGGGSDLQAYLDSGMTGYTISTAIDKYVYLILNPKHDKSIRLSYSITENVSNVEELQHDIVKACLNLFDIKTGIEIVSVADLPHGTGLGSSSSFTVGLLKAIDEFNFLYNKRPQKYMSHGQYTIFSDACLIEQTILGKPIGRQDQAIAAYGGVRLFEYTKTSTKDISNIIFEANLKKIIDHMILVPVGNHREASSILKNQTNNLKTNDLYIKKTRELSQLCFDIEISLTRAEPSIENFAKVLQKNWEIKKSLSNDIFNEEIQSLESVLKSLGFIAMKLLGAGGGGYMLGIAPEKEIIEIANNIFIGSQKINIEKNGVQLITI